MSRTLVIVHFYYPEQVDTLLKHLENITIKYDLYCSIGNAQNYEQIRNQVLNFKNDAHIVDVANVGYDVWPFIKIINDLDLSQYDYVIKLHTKRDMPGTLPCPLGNGFFVGPGGNWRDCLYSFLDTKDNFEKCLRALEKPDVGMCARFNVIHDMAKHFGVISYARKNYPNYILNLRNFCFVAGTMFIAKSTPFQILKDMHMTENLFEKPKQDHSTQFAHVIERTIGEVFYKSGMKIVDPFTPLAHIQKIKNCYRKRKWIKRVINYICFPCFIAKYRRKLHQKLIDKFYPAHINEKALLFDYAQLYSKKNKSNNKKVVYGCITGGYDAVPVHGYVAPDWDYVLFTDNADLIKRGKFEHWTIKPLVFDKLTNVKNARWHKVNAHKLFPEYDYSLWLDSSIIINNKNPFDLLNDLIKKNTLVAVPNHPLRKCIYDEAEEIKRCKIDFAEIVDKEMDFLHCEKYPKNNGLSETNILLRKHNEMQDTLDLWWRMIRVYSKRDQLSFNYALWKTGVVRVPIYTDENGFGAHRQSSDFTFVFAPSHTQDKITQKRQPGFLVRLFCHLGHGSKSRKKSRQTLQGYKNENI